MIAAQVAYGTYLWWATVLTVLTIANMVYNWMQPSRHQNEVKFASKEEILSVLERLDAIQERLDNHIDHGRSR